MTSDSSIYIMFFRKNQGKKRLNRAAIVRRILTDTAGETIRPDVLSSFFTDRICQRIVEAPTEQTQDKLIVQALTAVEEGKITIY